MSDMSDLATKGEVARLFKVSLKTVDHWVAAGRLPAPVINRPYCVRFRQAEIRKALEALSQPTDAPEATPAA